jgi:hypothetical protein
MTGRPWLPGCDPLSRTLLSLAAARILALSAVFAASSEAVLGTAAGAAGAAAAAGASGAAAGAAGAAAAAAAAERPPGAGVVGLCTLN